MSKIALIGADAAAFGHPAECTEPAPGTVNSDSTHNITVTVSGTTREIASLSSASIDFPTHAHDHTTEEGCHQNESHTLSPSTGEASITINGSPVYIQGNAVASDPTTGGDVDITSNPTNTNITI
jgi:uncharacterized Zn-binding protein involved in type VI secretion